MSNGKVVTALRLTARVAQDRIREIAKITANIIFGTHAQERMNERGIDDVDVLRILREGHIDDPPEVAQPGEWKCKVTLKMKGGRTAGVLVIILRVGKLFVKTVEWEDLP